MRTISIIGIGRVGGAIALALTAKEYRIESLISRGGTNAETIAGLIDPSPEILTVDELSRISSDIVLITTQDNEIGGVSRSLAAALKHRPFVFHTSGSLSSQVLGDLTAIGCRVGSIHPLISLSDPLIGHERMAGGYFCVEGDAEAVELARHIVADLGGNSFTIETKLKALYHAGAVMAAGHVTALLDTSFEVLTKCGLESNAAKQILLPLVKSTIANLEVQSSEKALTGTFARADSATFDSHLNALKSNVSSEVLELYLQLAVRSLHLAESNGVDRERVESLREKVLMAKRDGR